MELVTLGQSAVKSSKIDWATTPQSYSTSEVNTGAKWIDGKDIYKKTINFGALPNNTTKTVAHGITGIDQFVRPLSASADNGSTSLPIPYSNIDPNSLIWGNINTTSINISTAADRTSYTRCYVTLYYTKT